ncbi:hypothetical protein [Paraburkholderia unamae]|uniref:Uncharacterized protein n=1 Tax=Paraburkholderia unamae TaxID=219649 RepID=A0ACC6RMR5_9BURK
MSAILYELAASASQLCAPVPAAAAGGWTDWLDHWQTLQGAAVGGFMGVAGAWIVAGSQRSREQRIAAGMVLPDLHQLAAAGLHLAQLVPAQRRAHTSGAGGQTATPDEQRIPRLVRTLAARRPVLFALHTPVIGQLTDIDARLYGHLFQCEMTHRQFEDGIRLYEAAPQYLSATLGGKPASAPSRPPPPAPLIYADWQRAVEHATLAAYLLDRLVFSRWPRWVQRCRMKLRPNDLDRRSAHLIRTGELPPAPGTQPGRQTGET